MSEQLAERRIAVVIPCYRAARHILGVLQRVGPEVWRIYVVDDACPDATGDVVEAGCPDSRVRVIRNAKNLGVGGAVMAGYRAALRDGATVMVKLDGDGQMDPSLIPRFVEPIIAGQADYTKGNRFFDLASLQGMPLVRVFGNTVLSLMAKVSTGYWTLFDPTNGYTAIDARVASWLRMEAISPRYFFETDILFRLNTLRAVVFDIAIDSVYGDEQSNLKVSGVLGEFFWSHLRNAIKRVFYNYFLRDMSAASLQLVSGFVLIVFGLAWGITRWMEASAQQVGAPLGTIMLAVLPLLVGTQLSLGFLAYDVANVPAVAVAARLGLRVKKSERPSAREQGVAGTADPRPNARPTARTSNEVPIAINAQAERKIREPSP